MAIPDYETVMLPLLRLISDGKEHWIRDVIENLTKEFNLSQEEKRELLPSGQQAVFDNRVGWARTYLIKAGLLDSTRRGYIKITGSGLKTLEQKPSKIDSKYLERFAEFIEFKKVRKDEIKSQKTPTVELTPLELIERGYQDIQNQLKEELLSIIKNCSPDFFEKLVIDLLLSMGYGGSKKEAAKKIGRVGDEGIDGIIQEDKLGLDIIYIQAKKWDGSVGRPEVQKFVGALHSKKDNRGIFITTSSFSKEAQDYIKLVDSKVVLIDGEQLTQYMIDHNIGVSTISNYSIKKLDSDYFDIS